MKTVNIRQLKTNPSTALAAARADDMVVVLKHHTHKKIRMDNLNILFFQLVQYLLMNNIFPRKQDHYQVTNLKL